MPSPEAIDRQRRPVVGDVRGGGGNPFERLKTLLSPNAVPGARAGGRSSAPTAGGNYVKDPFGGLRTRQGSMPGGRAGGQSPSPAAAGNRFTPQGRVGDIRGGGGNVDRRSQRVGRNAPAPSAGGNPFQLTPAGPMAGSRANYSRPSGGGAAASGSRPMADIRGSGAPVPMPGISAPARSVPMPDARGGYSHPTGGGAPTPSAPRRSGAAPSGGQPAVPSGAPTPQPPGVMPVAAATVNAPGAAPPLKQTAPGGNVGGSSAPAAAVGSIPRPSTNPMDESYWQQRPDITAWAKANSGLAEKAAASAGFDLAGMQERNRAAAGVSFPAADRFNGAPWSTAQDANLGVDTTGVPAAGDLSGYQGLGSSGIAAAYSGGNEFGGSMAETDRSKVDASPSRLDTALSGLTRENSGGGELSFEEQRRRAFLDGRDSLEGLNSMKALLARRAGVDDANPQQYSVRQLEAMPERLLGGDVAFPQTGGGADQTATAFSPDTQFDVNNASTSGVDDYSGSFTSDQNVRDRVGAYMSSSPFKESLIRPTGATPGARVITTNGQGPDPGMLATNADLGIKSTFKPGEQAMYSGAFGGDSPIGARTMNLGFRKDMPPLNGSGVFTTAPSSYTYGF